MDFGTRQIRTAGKGSGSIEVTLPAELRDLVGLSCRVTLTDGTRPQLVLQPDLAPAHAAFAGLWRAMAGSLCDDPPAFALADFATALQPPGNTARPTLCWRDGLALLRRPHEAAPLARTLAAFGHALAPGLGIAAGLAAEFGAACARLAAGVTGNQEAGDLAAASLTRTKTGHAPGAPLRAAEAAGEPACGPAFWQRAGPLLAEAADLFVVWTADPSRHATLRAAWRRGLSIELSGG